MSIAFVRDFFFVLLVYPLKTDTPGKVHYILKKRQEKEARAHLHDETD